VPSLVAKWPPADSRDGAECRPVSVRLSGGLAPRPIVSGCVSVERPHLSELSGPSC
jgi:hypothetical protein